MTQPLIIPANETGKVRVFELNMPEDRAEDLRQPGGPDGVLGVLQVDPAYVEIFPVEDLEQLGLAGYLVEGCGIPAEQVAPDRARLEALKSHVMLVLSRAFGGRAVTLHPTSDVRLVATYEEPPLDWTATQIETASARPNTDAPRSPRAARQRARQIGGGIFAAFMLLIAAVVYLVLR